MYVTMKAADYLRIRREAEGLTIDDVAIRLAGRFGLEGNVKDTLRQVETPGATISLDSLVDAYARVVPIDADVYRQLRDEPVERHPSVCQSCGCSRWQSCTCREGQSCTIDETGTCTACAERMQDRSGDMRAHRFVDFARDIGDAAFKVGMGAAAFACFGIIGRGALAFTLPLVSG